MKKKLLMAILGISLVMTLCSCNKNVNDENQNIENEQKESADEDEADSVADSGEDISGDDFETPPMEMSADYYIFNTTAGKYYKFYYDGMLCNEVNVDELISENIPNGYSYLIDADADCQVFFLSRDEGTALYVNDTQGFRVLAEDVGYPEVNVNEGNIYVQQTIYPEGESGHTISTLYTQNTDGTYEKNEVYATLSALIDDFGYYSPNRYYGDPEHFEMAYCADKYGIVPLQSSNEIIVYDPTGKCLDTIADPNGNKLEFKGYNGRYMAIEAQNDDYVNDTLLIYDFVTGKRQEIASVENPTHSRFVATLDMNSEFVFYAVTDFDRQDGTKLSEIHSFNFDTGEDKLIKQLTSQTGHNCFPEPGLFGFKAFDDLIVFPDEAEDSTKWFMETTDGTDWYGPTETELVAKKYSYADFGQIKVNDYIMKCPYCDKDAFRYHNEYMEFDNRVNNYEKINETIKAIADADYENSKSFEITYSEEDCLGYLHGGVYVTYEEDTTQISEVRRVLDHYIFIQSNYYWYPMGAAHGMPGYVNFLFDENTGEEVTFDDIYQGDDELLATLAAKSAGDMFDEGKIAFFASEKDELLSQVKESVYGKYPTISFYEDHITLDFMPYDIAPFSEGIISIPVSYSDLGIGPMNVSDASNNETADTYDMDFVDVFGQHYTATIDKSLPMHPYDCEKFINKDGVVRYEDDMYTSKLGVDVSKYQGNVDFEAVKNSGFEFAYIRLGYRGYGKAGTLALDNMFEKNMVAAVDAGLDVGVYFFSQAITEEEAKEEAEFVLDALTDIKSKYGEKYAISLPVVYDPESILDHEARTDDVSAAQFTANTHSFIDTVKKSGNEAMLYCNMLWEIFNLETKDIFNGDIRIWYADYEPLPQSPYMFEIWQYTNQGSVPGIGGEADIDLWIYKK